MKQIQEDKMGVHRNLTGITGVPLRNLTGITGVPLRLHQSDTNTRRQDGSSQEPDRNQLLCFTSLKTQTGAKMADSN